MVSPVSATMAATEASIASTLLVSTTRSFKVTSPADRLSPWSTCTR
ncbi:hypothetical protein [Sorangium sp. So ce693]